MKAKQTQSLSGTALDSTGLLKLVQLGDVAPVRRHFNRSLANLPYVRPDWSHLKAALETGNREMMKLLVTWGAKPSDDDLKTLAEKSPRQFGEHLLLLRLAGIFLSKEIEALRPALVEETTPAKEDYQGLIDKIPQDWKNVLQALHDNKAHDAFIAGGALRDLLNGKNVSDVDIFIPNMDPMMVERYLRKVFKSAGMNCYEIEGRDSYWDHDWGRIHGFNATKVDKRNDLPNQLNCRPWKILAGSDRNSIIPYNIIFVDPNGASTIAQTIFKPVIIRTHYTFNDIVPKFDIGLCQIAYDGNRVITTEAFEKDQSGKTLSVINPNSGTRSHLERLQAKYPENIIDKTKPSVHDLTEEWLKLLTAIQEKAPEAQIAGGALRDTFNNRAIKDVDIFLCNRRFAQKGFIKAAFAAAGLTIKPQTVTRTDGYSNIQTLETMVASRAPAFEVVEEVRYRDSYGDVFTRNKLKSSADSWTVISASGTEYNIVFLSGEIEKALKSATTAKARADILTGSFDIGICQIATDGKNIFESEGYKLDVASKRLTLLRPNHSSLAHLDRMIQKYPDFSLCPAAAKLTGASAPRKVARSRYTIWPGPL